MAWERRVRRAPPPGACKPLALAWGPQLAFGSGSLAFVTILPVAVSSTNTRLSLHAWHDPQVLSVSAGGLNLLTCVHAESAVVLMPTTQAPWRQGPPSHGMSVNRQSAKWATAAPQAGCCTACPATLASLGCVLVMVHNLCYMQSLHAASTQ